MSRVRVQVSVDIQVLSPLHVGSGLNREVDAVCGDDRSNTAPRVAAIQRDADGNPWLPGSTIKGLLRRLAGGVAGTDALLGSVERRGGLIVAGAVLRTPGDPKHLLPYADRTDSQAPGALRPGVFVAAGTRIAAASGVAESTSLRHEEAVAPGGIFPLAFTIEVRGLKAGAQCDAHLTVLLRILSALDRPAGQAIGAGRADGDGRVRLCAKTLTVTKAVLGSDGTLVPQPLSVTLPVAADPGETAKRWVLPLACDGPFAVLDPSRAQERRPGDGSPALAAQRSSATTPVLPGSSVTGALRARAAWIAALAAHRAGQTPQRDDPTVVYQPVQRAKLTSVQRLFGVTGYRGLLEIEELTVLPSATPWQVFSVKLDRFSGGPMSGGLFETDAFLGVRVRLVLRLRDGARPTAEDQALAEGLVDDLRRNGLTLGHGGNKGFGWFTVEKTHAV